MDVLGGIFIFLILLLGWLFLWILPTLVMMTIEKFRSDWDAAKSKWFLAGLAYMLIYLVATILLFIFNRDLFWECTRVWFVAAPVWGIYFGAEGFAEMQKNYPEMSWEKTKMIIGFVVALGITLLSGAVAFIM